MTIWWLVLTLGMIAAGGVAFLWIAIHMQAHQPASLTDLQGKAEDDVERIFNDEFREELRNRGRLHFEKILGENAMFLQQDLRLTTSQLNDYMKTEISTELKEAFTNYQSAISDAKQLAIESIDKTKQVIDEQRRTLGSKLEKEVSDEKERRIALFDEQMAGIVNHYVLQAIGDQIDLSDQLEYILSELETNKQAITEDIRSGS